MAARHYRRDDGLHQHLTVALGSFLAERGAMDGFSKLFFRRLAGPKPVKVPKPDKQPAAKEKPRATEASPEKTAAASDPTQEKPADPVSD